MWCSGRNCSQPVRVAGAATNERRSVHLLAPFRPRFSAGRHFCGVQDLLIARPAARLCSRICADGLGFLEPERRKCERVLELLLELLDSFLVRGWRGSPE